MRTATMIAMLAAGAVTIVSSPAAQSQDAPFCIAGRGCVPSSAARYNACYQLALQRGLNTSRGDRHNVNAFIYECLAGKIPR